EARGPGLGKLGGLRAAFGYPLIPTAVQHGDGQVPEPAQQPPQARRNHAALRVIGDDLLAGIDARMTELLREALGIGERVASVLSGLGSGQVLVQVQEARAGNVRLRVLGAPALRGGEIVAAVEDDPVGIVEMPGECVRSGERREDHSAILPGGRAIQMWPSSPRFRYAWKYIKSSSIGDWYGPTSLSPRSRSRRRPRSMRLAMMSSSSAVSM